MAGDGDLSSQVATQIAQLRRERGWSLEDLAAAAGIHRTSLGLIERGKRGMTLDVAGRLAVALGRRLSDLVATAEDQTDGSD